MEAATRSAQACSWADVVKNGSTSSTTSCSEKEEEQEEAVSEEGQKVAEVEVRSEDSTDLSQDDGSWDSSKATWSGEISPTNNSDGDPSNEAGVGMAMPYFMPYLLSDPAWQMQAQQQAELVTSLLAMEEVSGTRTPEFPQDTAEFEDASNLSMPPCCQVVEGTWTSPDDCWEADGWWPCTLGQAALAPTPNADGCYLMVDENGCQYTMCPSPDGFMTYPQFFGEDGSCQGYNQSWAQGAARQARTLRKKGGMWSQDSNGMWNDGGSDDHKSPTSAASSKAGYGSSAKREHANVQKQTNFAAGHTDQSEITTLMLRNIPNQYDREMLMGELEFVGFGDLFDFIYVPMDKATQWNVGYAFVNFVNPKIAKAATSVLTNYRFCRYGAPSQKVTHVSPAHLQGLEKNAEYYNRTAVGRSKIAGHRPLVLTGQSDPAAAVETNNATAPAAKSVVVAPRGAKRTKDTAAGAAKPIVVAPPSAAVTADAVTDAGTGAETQERPE